MRFHRRLPGPAFLALLILLIAGGCAVKPVDEGIQPSEAQLIEQARRAEAREEYEQAAQDYLQAARITQTANPADYRMRAVSVLLRGNFVDQAREILYGIDEAPLTAGLKLRWRILAARIALTENQPHAALDILAAPDLENAAPEQAARAREIRARAFLRVGNFLESARERVSLASLIPPSDKERARANQEAIWQALQRLTEDALLQMQVEPPPDVFTGWLALARIAKLSQAAPLDVAALLGEWRSRFPGHPVSADIIDSLLARQQEETRRPAHIALLLPHGGPYARAAAALRNGFLAAHYNRGNQSYQPVIQIYDVGEDSSGIDAVYEQAIADGADFIVGPLRKDAVNRLADRPRLPVPTLTLNYSSDPSHATGNIYQFGLAPEDEARQVAERAWLDGHNQALALIPEGSWGERVLEAFRADWELLGGTLLEYQFYPSGKNDFSRQIQALLNLDESHQRRKRLEQVLGQSLKFEPRRRQDAGFVFLGAFPRQARLLRPQLKFHYASRLPVYATSHIYTGHEDRNADRDMDGVIFTDIPWVLHDRNVPQPLKQQVMALWPKSVRQFTRFYALGIDAYNIIPSLNTMRKYRYERFFGHTGILHLGAGNRIFRETAWGRFKNGIPVPY
ncbi:MAG TPA: penicillin-binding protein activator [Chromatiales bacterium]|nr:penicillin-binding protein activator [Chromatiales bacterium]